MDQSEIVSYANDHVPELTLLAAGFIMLMIVWTYLRDRDGMGYKAMVVLGVAAGIVMAVMLVDRGDRWYSFGKTVIAIAAFALIIRPFKDTNFALIIAALVMVLVYSWLGGLTGDLDFLAEGWPRVIVAVVAGGIVYSILNFVQSIAEAIGKILNWWPILFILGTLCLLEGALVISGSESLLDIYHDYMASEDAESIVAMLA